MTDPRMTPTNDAPVTVEQCDRDFAARWIVIPAQNVHRVQNGKWDDHYGVQAAARHRLAALASAPAGDGVDIAGEMDRFEAAYPCCDLAKYKGGEVIAGRARYAEPQVDKMFSAWLSSAALARPRAAVGEREA